MGSVNRISVVARTVPEQDNRTDVCVCECVCVCVFQAAFKPAVVVFESSKIMLILDSATRRSVSKDLF
jgi:hypothetical protein